MAPGPHALMHFWAHFPFVRYRQVSGSTVAFSGTACGKGMYIAPLLPMPSLCSSGIFPFKTHACTHAAHPVHFSISTYRVFLRTLTLKLPASPLIFLTSL